MPLTQTQKIQWRQVVKVAATNLGMLIRSLSPSNPVHLAWVNTDRHSNMFANVIPTVGMTERTKQYRLRMRTLLCSISEPGLQPYLT